MTGLECAAAVPERGVHAALVARPGRTVALLGPNGSGKSTMLAVAAGLLRPARATVTVGGTPAQICQDSRTWVPPHRRPITLLTQDPALFTGMTALDNVAFGPRARGMTRAGARSTAQGWLERAGAAHLASVRAESLSGGQAQRVAIARALASAPTVLLLDEPLASLDVDAAGEVRALLGELLHEVTAVIATHHLLDASLLADDVLVMHEGTVAEQGTRAEVLTRPRHSFTARLAGRGLMRTPAGFMAPQPSQVILSAEGHGVAGTVRRVEAHADVARVWVDVRDGILASDVDPVTAHPAVLAPGAPVVCAVAPDVATYH